MNALIWDYVAYHYDEHGIIPSWEQITEDLDEKMTEKDFDELDHTVTSFIKMHDLTGVTVKYKGEPKRRFINDESPGGHHKTA